MGEMKISDAISAAEMREVERAAIDSGRVSGRELMERAGEGVLRALAAHWPGRAGGVALVLCGPGNNGGDGFVVARLLAGQGWRVACYLLGDPGRLPPDARHNHERWAARGSVHPAEEMATALPGADLIVDACFGIGLSRPLAPPVSDLAERLNDRAAGASPVLAVDLPSGLEADLGTPVGGGAVIRADLTVTFHRPKRGHLLGQGPALCGALSVQDIGL